MPARLDFPFVPMIVAASIAFLSGAWLWADIRNDTTNSGGDITSAVVAQAGATLTSSEPPRLSAPRTVPAFR